jgi:hypothetical protein
LISDSIGPNAAVRRITGASNFRVEDKPEKLPPNNKLAVCSEQKNKGTKIREDNINIHFVVLA